jgi:hypothetical protein
MSRLIQATVGPLATAAANNIALTQTPLAAGNLTLNGALVVGGVASLDLPRHVIVTSAGNDSTVTFTAYGTDFSGQALVASTLGAAIGAADFGVSFATVSRITTSAATAAAVTVGTNTVADSRPIFLDPFGFAPTSIQVNVVGTVNYTVRQSLDNPNGATGFGVPLGMANVNWLDHPDLNVVAATTTKQSNYAYIPTICKVVLNSGTGSVTLEVIQAASPSI